jgi:hypothetical protein
MRDNCTGFVMTKNDAYCYTMIGHYWNFWFLRALKQG